MDNKWQELHLHMVYEHEKNISFYSFICRHGDFIVLRLILCSLMILWHFLWLCMLDLFNFIRGVHHCTISIIYITVLCMDVWLMTSVHASPCILMHCRKAYAAQIDLISFCCNCIDFFLKCSILFLDFYRCVHSCTLLFILKDVCHV